MKKLVMFAMALLMVMPCTFAQSSKLTKMIEKEQLKQQKALIKARSVQVGEEIKKYSKDGWVLDGSAKSVEVVFREYYQKMLMDPEYRELQANAVGTTDKSLNLVQNIALNNAMNKYAQEARSHVAGRVVSNMGQINNTELENFYGAYERLVSSTIEGELQFQFGFYRDKDGKREYVAFYLINEKEASAKRINAMKRAQEETKVAQEMANDISAFVREGFRTDEAR